MDPGASTQLLKEWSNGSALVLEELVPLVYMELRKQAARYMRRERPGHTLQTTALIHETYLKLVDQRQADWKNRAHFFGISSKIMRRILLDHARSRSSEKRGGGAINLPLEDDSVAAQEPKSVDLIALDEALDRLAEIDEQQARIVELKYFSGLSLNETAEVMKVSRTTVANNWNVARAWLYRELTR
ncbi:MAG TPA: sigma-70 family RNA polymerase sigma factor [Pyrinomonadaceae bacterium]|nr:sigma-70 family RNA polymerase sigma factor [Pyrinomonadaceae bacterium]